MIDMIILALDEAMWAIYFEMVEFLQEFWFDRSSSFNPGQQSIYWQHLEDAIEQWLEDAGESWPDADPYDYLDGVYGAYDMEVTERAFSDTIETPEPRLETYIEKAQQLASLKEALEAVDNL